MTDLRKAAQMALDALEHLQTDIEWQYKSPTRAMLRKIEKALRAALATEQDDGHCQACEGNYCTAKDGCVARDNPPQREWQGLTDEEIEQGMKQAYSTVQGRNLEVAFARAIEAKLREKNA